jgi:hypothetical protein
MSDPNNFDLAARTQPPSARQFCRLAGGSGAHLIPGTASRLHLPAPSPTYRGVTV